MGKLNKDNKGFGGVELVIVIVIVVLLGVVGWFVYKNHNKTATTKVAITTKIVTKTTPSTSSSSSSGTATNPYAGWKIYNSPLGGLSFQYPSNWVFDPATLAEIETSKTSDGSIENDSVLYSTAVLTKPGIASNVATNQFMCVTFDEYNSQAGNLSWNLEQMFGPLLSSENFDIANTKLSLNTYQGSSPMLDTLELVSIPSSSHGSQFIDLQNGYIVSVQAQFNCGQGGPPGITNLNADFNSQPETAVAKLIMKSIKL